MLYPTVLMGVVTTAILINKTNSNHRCWWFNQEFSVLLNKWGTQTGIKPGLYNAAFPQHGSPDVLVDTKLRCSGFLSKSQSLGNSELPEKNPFFSFLWGSFLILLLILDNPVLVNPVFSMASSCSACAKSLFHMCWVCFAHMWNNILASCKQNIYSKEKETCVFYLSEKICFMK